MGYQTTIMFLNDAAGDIMRNPEQVVRNILDAMNHTGRKPKTYSIGSYGNPMEAMPTAHADVPRLYMTYGNSFVEFGPYTDSINNLIIRKEFFKKARQILKEEEKEIKRLEAQRKQQEENV